MASLDTDHGHLATRKQGSCRLTIFAAPGSASPSSTTYPQRELSASASRRSFTEAFSPAGSTGRGSFTSSSGPALLSPSANSGPALLSPTSSTGPALLLSPTSPSVPLGSHSLLPPGTPSSFVSASSEMSAPREVKHYSAQQVLDEVAHMQERLQQIAVTPSEHSPVRPFSETNKPTRQGTADTVTPTTALGLAIPGHTATGETVNVELRPPSSGGAAPDQTEFEPLKCREMDDDLLLPFVDRVDEVKELLFTVPQNQPLTDLIRDCMTQRPSTSPDIDKSWTYEDFERHLDLTREKMPDGPWLKELGAQLAARSESVWARLRSCFGVDMEDIEDAIEAAEARKLAESTENSQLNTESERMLPAPLSFDDTGVHFPSMLSPIAIDALSDGDQILENRQIQNELNRRSLSKATPPEEHVSRFGTAQQTPPSPSTSPSANTASGGNRRRSHHPRLGSTSSSGSIRPAWAMQPIQEQPNEVKVDNLPKLSQDTLKEHDFSHKDRDEVEERELASRRLAAAGLSADFAAIHNRDPSPSPSLPKLSSSITAESVQTGLKSPSSSRIMGLRFSAASPPPPNPASLAEVSSPVKPSDRSGRGSFVGSEISFSGWTDEFAQSDSEDDEAPRQRCSFATLPLFFEHFVLSIFSSN